MMNQTMFQDAVQDMFHVYQAEDLSFSDGEWGEHARAIGINMANKDALIADIEAENFNWAINETARGPEIEIWSQG